MSWLISLLIAGTMLSTDGNLPTYFQANNNPAGTKNTRTVRRDETERFEQTYPLSANGRISVSNVNGSITVEGWDRNEVKLEYVKTAETKERLADVQVKINAQANSLDVDADYNFSWNRRNNGDWKNKNSKGAQIEFRLMVPHGAVLDEIETVNGSVNISKTTNSAKVSAVNGEVKTTNISGTAELSTVNGAVTADFERLENASQIKLETVNGQAFLTLPSDANATIRAETMNGRISNDFGLPVRKGRFVGNTLYGRIGAGDVRIKLESVNGELGVRRRQDGKNPNPVTNLLGASADDEDAYKDMDESVEDAVREAGKVKVKIPEINAEVQRAMQDAQKEIAEARRNMSDPKIREAMRQAMEQQKIAMQAMRSAGWMRGMPNVERKSETFPVKGKPKVMIDAEGYSVFVRGWDRQEVQYTITQISRANSPASGQLATVDHSDSEVKIRTEKNSPASTNAFGGRMRIEIFVPRKSDLKIKTNREVRLENVSGELDVQGGEEAVDVRDSDGSLIVSAGDGKIRVIGFQGVVDAKGGDGLMSLEGDFRELSAQTASGNIILTLPENTNALIESNQNELIGEGVTLDRQNSRNDLSIWKVGNGGQNYSLKTEDGGTIFVRGAGAIKTN